MMRPTDTVEVTPEVTCTVSYKIFYSKVNVYVNPCQHFVITKAYPSHTLFDGGTKLQNNDIMTEDL
jgi:hypothetical protein